MGGTKAIEYDCRAFRADLWNAHVKGNARLKWASDDALRTTASDLLSGKSANCAR